MLRNLLVSLAVAMSAGPTLAVAPATAGSIWMETPDQVEMPESGLDMVITKVSEIAEAVLEQPEIPELEKLVEPSLHVTPLGDGYLQTFGFEGEVELNSFGLFDLAEPDFESVEELDIKIEEVEKPESEPSQTKVKPVQLKVEPAQVKAVEPSQPPLGPSRVPEPKPLTASWEKPVQSKPVIKEKQIEQVRPLEPANVQRPKKFQSTSEPSQIKVEKTRALIKPAREKPLQKFGPSRILKEKKVYVFRSPTRVQKVKPSLPNLEPSRVVQKDVVSKATPKNNIQPFSLKRHIFKTAPPTPKVSPGKTAVGLKEIPRLVQEVVKNSRAVPGTAFGSRREIAAFAPETAYSLGHSQNYSGTKLPTFKPETAYGFSQVNRVSGPPVHLPKTVSSLDRDIEVTNVPTTAPPQQNAPPSIRAADLGEVEGKGKVHQQAAEVESQQAQEPELEPTAPKFSISGGVSGIGASPTLETSLGLEYEGLSATLSHSRPLDVPGPSELGLDVTLPISEQSKLTISSEKINSDPTLSATVKSKVSSQLTASAAFNSINKPDAFNLELAATYQIDKRWSVDSSFNVTTHQLNLGASHTIFEGVEATVKVDDIANTPQVGAGLTLELSPSTKLELSAENVTAETTFGVKVTQSLNF